LVVAMLAMRQRMPTVFIISMRLTAAPHFEKKLSAYEMASQYSFDGRKIKVAPCYFDPPRFFSNLKFTARFAEPSRWSRTENEASLAQNDRVYAFLRFTQRTSNDRVASRC
jgi:hypothetical protein